jgi:uncharacterized membrane protein YphA (DoxX/SURF4 family)
MLSIFPELFTYGLVAPFILRVALGSYFIVQGLRRHKQDTGVWENLWSHNGMPIKIGSLKVAPVLVKIQIVLGVLLFVGLYTQVATIFALVFVGAEVFMKHKQSPLSFNEKWFAVLVGALALSLLFLGAGFLAIDLPL